jgi:hypothetical protein
VHRCLWAFIATATVAVTPSNCFAKVKETAQGPSKCRCHPRKAWCYAQKVLSKEHSRPCRSGHVTKVRGNGNLYTFGPYGSWTRFFMIDRRREGEELCEEFKVLGSTGNVRWDQNTQFVNFSLNCWQVYTVMIGRLPSCDCVYIVHSLYFCLATPADSPPRPRRGSW